MAEAPQFRTTMEFAYGVARELAPGVVRLVANNPGPFTFKGTNTYLSARGDELALIDPGPADAAHLRGDPRHHRPAPPQPHPHHPHPPRPRRRPDGARRRHRRQDRRLRPARHRSPARRRTSPSGGEHVDHGFRARRDARPRRPSGGRRLGLHGAAHAGACAGPPVLRAGAAGSGAGVLFSGDHVMGWNTSVMAPPEGRMADYLRSLELLGERADRVYFPGHGGRVEEPQRLVKAFLLHRRMREQAILDCIRAGTNTVQGDRAGDLPRSRPQARQGGVALGAGARRASYFTGPRPLRLSAFCGSRLSSV